MPKTTLAKSSKRANLVKTKIGENGGGTIKNFKSSTYRTFFVLNIWLDFSHLKIKERKCFLVSKQN